MRAPVEVIHDAFSVGRTLSSIPVIVPRTIPKPSHPLGPHPINLRHLAHLRDPCDILIRHRLDPDEAKRARVARALLKAGREPHVAVERVRERVRRRAASLIMFCLVNMRSIEHVYVIFKLDKCTIYIYSLVHTFFCRVLVSLHVS